jgi:hypothetical protein
MGRIEFELQLKAFIRAVDGPKFTLNDRKCLRDTSSGMPVAAESWCSWGRCSS